MKKKQVLGSILALVCATVFTLAGCSTGQPVKEGGSESAGSNKNDTLVVVRQSDITSLDPHFFTDIPTASIMNNKIYESLVTQDQDMNIQPLLATEWKQLDDLTWEFTLREGVTFHDGTAFDAEAVIKTFQRVMDPELASPQAKNFAMIKEVTAVDDHTVRFALNYPFAPLLSVLATTAASILNPKVIEQYGKDLPKHIVGTGPFLLESRTPGDQFVLVKNGKYWGTQPKVNKVVFKIVPEDTTRTAMVETGEAQIAEPLPVTELERVQASSTMSMYRSEALGVDFIGFNTQKKPFDDPRVRQAVSYALNKESFLSGVYNNIGKVSNVPTSPKVFGYAPDVKGYPYDVNKAKALLAEAGYATGFKTTIWTSELNKERINLAEVIQSQLKGVGIDLQIVVMENGAFFDAINKGQHEMVINHWGNATGDADYNQFNLFHTDSFGASGNRFFYSNPAVDKLIEEGRKENDPAKRKEIYAKTQQMEIDDAAMIPFRVQENLAVISKSVKGYWINPIGYPVYNDAYLE